jgi:hypothetical protein
MDVMRINHGYSGDDLYVNEKTNKNARAFTIKSYHGLS